MIILKDLYEMVDTAKNVLSRGMGSRPVPGELSRHSNKSVKRFRLERGLHSRDRGNWPLKSAFPDEVVRPVSPDTGSHRLGLKTGLEKPYFTSMIHYSCWDIMLPACSVI